MAEGFDRDISFTKRISVCNIEGMWYGLEGGQMLFDVS